MGLINYKYRKKAFTLIELLVVVAVIAILMSILMTALASAKLNAKRLICATKMRQWTLAALAYASEHDYILTPFGDISDDTNGGNALNPETYYYNRLSPYLTKEYYGKWGMDDLRKCPMSKSNFGEDAVWIGVYYSRFNPLKAPFVYLNQWDGAMLIEQCKPFKTLSVKLPSNYLMMLDARRDQVFEPLERWPWNEDYDGDGMNDKNANAPPYNFAQPKIHRGGCNVGLFDGHVEWIRYKDFWEVDANSNPVHRYWYNNNRP